LSVTIGAIETTTHTDSQERCTCVIRPNPSFLEVRVWRVGWGS